MERIRKLWQGEQAYEPLNASIDSVDAPSQQSTRKTKHFSWLDYSVFLLLGIAMLWAWNMFLAAGPYFQRRFKSSQGISDNFQAAEISVSTITNLVSMLVLTKLQSNANYPKRIMSALLINTLVFSLLAAFTSIRTSAAGYFGFLITMIFTTSLATGLIQNGIFSFVSGFGIPQYTQGIMTGQAVAGVLPCLAQIISVLSVEASDENQPPTEIGAPQPPMPPGPPPVRSTAALLYFLTATIISVVTFIAFLFLVTRNRQTETFHASDVNTEPRNTRKTVPLLVLTRKLFWLAGAIILTFAVTMVFPVFTQRIVSVHLPEDQPPLLQPASFVPLAFLFWNVGDLVGRLLSGLKSLSLTRKPRLLFVAALGRILWIGLYHLCNIKGRGAVVQSDLFYLVIVQLFFGLSNGFIGSSCMIGAGEWVEEDEREGAGGFMSLCLVAGLTIGSLASFFIVDV